MTEKLKKQITTIDNNIESCYREITDLEEEIEEYEEEKKTLELKLEVETIAELYDINLDTTEDFDLDKMISFLDYRKLIVSKELSESCG